MKKIDPHSHIGEIHGVYEIIDVLKEKDKYGHYIYIAECKVCGYKKYSHYGGISGEKSKTYICNHLVLGSNKHIKPTKWENQRIKSIFHGIKQRCYNPKEESFRWYGAKGIKVCDEWLDNPKSFETWSLQNGYEDSLTIDRIDEDKDYSPNNCCWITPEENAKYKSTTSLIDINGEEHTGRDWAKILGLGTNIINNYIRTYGVDNTKEFIRRFIDSPNKHRKAKQSYYEMYMN